MPRIAFIPVASPKLRPTPPSGPEWLHEIKFDGFRIQLHKVGSEVRLFSRNGKDFTDRFPGIRDAVAALPAGGAIIDGEVVACDEDGKPDFYSLIRHRVAGVCVWCFDLLGLGGDDVRPRPLEERKQRLGALLSIADNDRLKLSESFDDGPLSERDKELLERWGCESGTPNCQALIHGKRYYRAHRRAYRH